LAGKVVLVSGLPRSGATLLHNLLALDGQLFAAFDFAEMHDPTAPAIPEPEVRSRLERLKRAMPQVSCCDKRLCLISPIACVRKTDCCFRLPHLPSFLLLFSVVFSPLLSLPDC
jgi:hypothetical protein